jgi:hypothetical protein
MAAGARPCTLWECLLGLLREQCLGASCQLESPRPLRDGDVRAQHPLHTRCQNVHARAGTGQSHELVRCRVDCDRYEVCRHYCAEVVHWEDGRDGKVLLRLI